MTTSNSPIDPGRTLGELVAERPARAGLFDDLRLDYCCGGRQTLAEACTKHRVPLNDALAGLQAIDDGGGGGTDVESTDWRTADVAELCAHIVSVHHDGLRDAFPRLERQLATVVRVHGDRHPPLREAQHLFADLRGELEPHLASEENELFPACIAHEHTGTPVDEELILDHEEEHVAVGLTLAALRALCWDYDPATALCSTHRTLLEGLEAFERDLHRHVHEENNVLLPRARSVHAADVGPAQSLPVCCQGWIGEQTHSWMRHHGRGKHG